jgi:hypothetical protein
VVLAEDVGQGAAQRRQIAGVARGPVVRGSDERGDERRRVGLDRGDGERVEAEQAHAG